MTVAQALEKATMGSLRASQYFDMHGTPISMLMMSSTMVNKQLTL